MYCTFKGTVAQDFLPLVFSTHRPHIVPEFTPKNIFEFCFKFAEIFVFKVVLWGRSIRPHRTLFCGVSDPAEQASAIKYTHLCHSSLGSDTPQDLVPLGLIPTPQDLVLRGLIPRRILFCGLSYPTGKLRPRRIRRKSFESLPFFLKGYVSKIVCMYKPHYPRLIVSMLKEPLS